MDAFGDGLLFDSFLSTSKDVLELLACFISGVKFVDDATDSAFRGLGIPGCTRTFLRVGFFLPRIHLHPQPHMIAKKATMAMRRIPTMPRIPTIASVVSALGCTVEIGVCAEIEGSDLL